MALSCVARASSINTANAWTAPGRRSLDAQTPGHSPAFDIERLAGSRASCTLVVIAVALIVGLVVRLVILAAAAMVRAFLVPVGPPATIISRRHERSVGPWHCRHWCWRGQGAHGPDDRPGRNNSKRCQSDRRHSKSSVCASPPRQPGVSDSHRGIRRQIKYKSREDLATRNVKAAGSGPGEQESAGYSAERRHSWPKRELNCRDRLGGIMILHKVMIAWVALGAVAALPSFRSRLKRAVASSYRPRQEAWSQPAPTSGRTTSSRGTSIVCL